VQLSEITHNCTVTTNVWNVFLLSDNIYGPVKPKFHYADFPEVSVKSATCHGEVADIRHVTGKSPSLGSFGVSNHRDMSRWFEKIPWQVGDKPVCVVLMEFWNEHDTTTGLSHVAARQAGQDTGKSATSRTSPCLVAGMSRACRGLVADVTGKSA